MISEAFCELDFKDAEETRRRRNQRILELQAQGMACTAENLYHVDGNRVYLLAAEEKIMRLDSKIRTLIPPNIKPSLKYGGMASAMIRTLDSGTNIKAAIA